MIHIRRINSFLIIGIFSVFPFFTGVTDKFVFDDVPAVLMNKDISSKSPSGLLIHDYWGGILNSATSHKSYRPLTSLTVWLQTQITSPASPPALGLKIGNLLLHLFNSFLLYTLVKGYRGVAVQLSRKKIKELALFTSVLFACHPVHVEPVVTVVGRADLLCSTFFLLSSIFTSSSPSLEFLNPLLALFALFSKEQGICLPLLWGATKMINTKLLRKNIVSVSSFIFLLKLTMIIVFLSILRLWMINFSPPTFQPGDNPTAALSDPILRILTYNYLYSLNVLILLWPSWLCCDWALGCVPTLKYNDIRISFVILLWCVVFAAAVKLILESRKRRYFLLWSLALLLIPFLLSMNIFVTVGFVIAERNLYFSVAGYALLVVRGAQLIKDNIQGKLLTAFFYMFVIITLSSLSLRSLIRSSEWRNELTLFTAGLTVCPNNAKVHYNIAKKRGDHGEVDLAILSYKEAVKLSPTYEHAINNLGNILKAKGDLDQAAFFLRQAIQLSPRFAAAHMNLAIVEQAQGQMEQAESHYLMALSLRHPYPDCVYNLGNLYLKTSRLIEAEDRLREAAKIGHKKAWSNLVLLLEEMGKLEDAQAEALKAVELFPADSELQFNLANIYGKQGQFTESEAAYLAAITLSTKPRAVHHGNLGVLYHRWGRYRDAETCYEAALAMKPNLVSARENLARLRRRK